MTHLSFEVRKIRFLQIEGTVWFYMFIAVSCCVIPLNDFPLSVLYRLEGIAKEKNFSLFEYKRENRSQSDGAIA